MKKLLIVVGATLALSACGSDADKCKEALVAFEGAKTLCTDTTETPDVWISETTCETAGDDSFDNTDFYECLIEKYENTTVAETCEVDADDMPTGTIDFPNINNTADPAGCRDDYNSTPT